jgi:hypothetical protein
MISRAHTDGRSMVNKRLMTLNVLLSFAQFEREVNQRCDETVHSAPYDASAGSRDK